MEWTTEDIFGLMLATASAIVLIGNALQKIMLAVQAVRAPGVAKDKRLDDIEDWKACIDAKLDKDKQRLDAIETGNRVTQRAILALLAHGIDGNNMQQMEDAKAELQSYLINR